MTPMHLILGGIATSLICTIGICVLILIERKQARRARLNAIKDLVIARSIRK